MRPEILNTLFAAPTSLPGIGDKLGKLVTKLAGPHECRHRAGVIAGEQIRGRQLAIRVGIIGIERDRALQLPDGSFRRLGLPSSGSFRRMPRHDSQMTQDGHERLLARVVRVTANGRW